MLKKSLNKELFIVTKVSSSICIEVDSVPLFVKNVVDLPVPNTFKNSAWTYKSNTIDFWSDHTAFNFNIISELLSSYDLVAIPFVFFHFCTNEVACVSKITEIAL